MLQVARRVTRHLQGLLWTQAVLALRPLRTVQFPPQRRLTQGFLPSLALNASCRRFRRTVMHWMRVGRIGILGALEMSTPPFRHARPIPLKHECSPVPRATRTPQTCGRCASFKGPSLSPPCQTSTRPIRIKRITERTWCGGHGLRVELLALHAHVPQHAAARVRGCCEPKQKAETPSHLSNRSLDFQA